LCLSPSKFGGGDGFKSNFGHVAEVTGSGVGGSAVGGVGVIAANNRKVVFSASSTWVFFASWLANFASSSVSRDSVFSVGIGLSEQERSMFSKGDEADEEGNSGGVTVRALSAWKWVICRNTSVCRRSH
jgi:hypothetical protein